MNEFSAVVEK